jgi:palmitoyltransferase
LVADGDGIKHQAAGAAALYVRCTAVDPSDRTHAKKMKRRRQLARARAGRRGGGGGGRLPRLRYGYILWRYVVRLLRRVEVRVMNRWVRRSYLEQWNSSVQLDPMLPFAFTSLDDIVSPHAAAGHDISYCPVCDCEVHCSVPLLCSMGLHCSACLIQNFK